MSRPASLVYGINNFGDNPGFAFGALDVDEQSVRIVNTE
jgi:hypothetical protein